MPSRVEEQDIFELAATILSSTVDLNKFLKKRKLPALSFEHPAPAVSLSPENAAFHNAKSTIVEAAERLIDIVRGPRDVLIELSFQHAMSYGLFSKSACGHVAHNSVSSLLVTDPDLEAWLYLCANIAYPAGAQIPKAIDQYGVSSEANETAYSVSIGRKISQFEHFREPDGHDEHEMFARAMRGISAGGAYDVRHVVDGGYPWHELEEKEGTLCVDVGGGPGHVSMALARKYPKLRFEVQDLPETVEVGARNCPEELKDRFNFRAHDFFKLQPEHNVSDGQAIVYFARFILHDWSDKYARQILEPLAKGMRAQDRLILNEVVVPEPGEMARQIERKCHDRDLLMLMNLNGRERTLNAFSDLFQAVTPRLRVSRVHRPPQGELSLIEVVLDGDGTKVDWGATNGISHA
ncbi:MAG: hypothetical protein Q9165_001777 [Trypethelium subeluteriae]